MNSHGATDTFAVLGNCQAPGLAECLRAQRPGAHVETFHLGTLRAGTPARHEELATELGHYDVVFTQPVDAAGLGPLRTDVLRSRVRALVPIPAITFAGFHPDSTYVSCAGKHVQTGIGPYSSLLVVASFLEKVPMARVAGLFNAYFYSKLGHFTRYQGAERFLLQIGNEVGYDLSACLPEWRGGGCFMHTHNHPRIRVLYTLAAMALAKAGLAADRASGPDVLVDRLVEDARWPVYPEIGRALGVAGDLAFERPVRMVGQHAPRALSLEEYVASSYEAYRAANVAFDADARVERARGVIRAAGVRW